MKKVTVINVRLPEDIISWIDVLVDRKVFNSRSEAIREFSRDYVLKERGRKLG
ncbi:MAG: ribbon-helix-helix protein, CopG family [Nanoarchaeota archaeon]|nr:ribbon-helix-helix protein, CopG family [Nanoarchaeota archaeon]